MKTITQEMREQLRNPLPLQAVSQHPTKSYLSSIKAIYVTERLSDVFGIGAWRTKISNEAIHEKGMVTVKVTLEIPEYGVYYECYGGNDNGGENSKNFDLGDAFKGATTDALTKIGSWLEIGIDVFKGIKTPAPNQFKEKPKKPLLEKGSEQWKQAINHLLKGTVTIEAIKAKYTLLEPNEDELLSLTKTTNKTA